MAKKLEVNSGDKYGRFTIIKEIERKNGHRCFLCECSCGNKIKKEVKLQHLRNKHTTSCGCYRKEIARETVKRRKKNYIGETFGKLTIIQEIESLLKTRRVLAQCSCDGNIKEYCLYTITWGDTTSCGCYREEVNKIKKLTKDYQNAHPIFCKIEEIMDNPNGLGILVRCKKCGEWFPPTKQQLSIRIKTIEKPHPNYPGAENNFYCGDKCKQECDTYRSINIPKSLRNIVKQSRCNQPINREILLQLQIDEYGYNYCEVCGGEFKSENLFLHHNIMVSKDYTEADNMCHQILVCRDHHKHDNC